MATLKRIQGQEGSILMRAVLLLVALGGLAFVGSAAASDAMLPVLLKDKLGVPTLPNQGAAPETVQSPGTNVVLGPAGNSLNFLAALMGALAVTAASLVLLTRQNARRTR
jgi:hypothetical protein